MHKLILLILTLSTFTLTSCGPVNVTPPGTGGTPAAPRHTQLKVSVDTPVTTIDPAYIQSDGEVLITKLIFEGLVKEDTTGKLVPHIATKWDISPDKLTYTFHLKKGVYFHNGREITADDFKFSWERVLRLNAPPSYLFAPIKGADAVISGAQRQAVGIEAVDEYTLRVTLLTPLENFVSSLAHPGAAVLDRYEVVEQGVDFARPGTATEPGKPVSGTGPFALIEWADGQVLALGRNDAYFERKPWISRVEFLLNQPTEDALIKLVAGNIDIVYGAVAQAKPKLADTADRIVVENRPVLAFRYLAINSQQPPFNIKEVREALLYGIDELGVLHASRGEGGEVLSGYVTDYWYRQSVTEKAYYSFRPDMTGKLLEQAGFPGGAGLPEITLFCGPTSEDLKAARHMAEDLNIQGFRIKIKPLAYRDLRKAIETGEAAIYLAKYTPRTTDLGVFFLERVHSRWQKTIVQPQWDMMIDQSGEQAAPSRINTFRQLERELTGDARLKVIYTYKSAVAKGGNVTNFRLTPLNIIMFGEVAKK